MHILGKMQEAMPQREAPSCRSFAPRMITIKINPEKIRDVIGKGGAVIRALTEETGTHHRHRGRRHRHHRLGRRRRPARQRRSASRTSPPKSKSGKIYEGTVLQAARLRRDRATSCRARTACCTSRRSPTSASSDVTDYLKEGQIVRVKVLETDEKGRVRLSMKALLNEGAPHAEPTHPQH